MPAACVEQSAPICGEVRPRVVKWFVHMPQNDPHSRNFTDHVLIRRDSCPMTVAAAPRIPSGALIARDQALLFGISRDDIKRRLERGEWVALRPGAYVRADVLASMSDVQRHRLQIDATAVGSAEIISHRSAAVLHGIDLIQVPGRRVTVTRPTARAGRRTSVLHTYCAPIDKDEVVQVGPHLVTDPARTIVDLARCLPFADAVAAADSALHRKLVTPEELVKAVARAPRRPGIRAAHRVIAFASPLAESVGESRSRVLITRELLPEPTLQLPIRDETGVVVAHTDFGWEEQRTVGEFDGVEKYGRQLRPGVRPGDRIYEEKLREDRIRRLGWNVVRWTWSELDQPGVVGDRIRRALENADRRRSRL